MPFKLSIFILNGINIRAHPPRAQYIILSNADTKMNTFLAFKKAVSRRLINNSSLEKLVKGKFHAFSYFFSFSESGLPDHLKDRHRLTPLL